MTDSLAARLGADFVWPLWDGAADETAISFADESAPTEDAVLRSVATALCFGYVPAQANGRAVLVIAGGGYTQLVIGKEGVEVARWLASIGYHAFVLAHRFPDARNGVQAPLDDAIEAMRIMRARSAELGVGQLGVLGLSSGGHLAASLAATYPAEWLAPASRYSDSAYRPDFLIVGYAPLSTNAAGRTIVPDKAALAPPEKQAFYDTLQPDLQLAAGPPPAFLFYAANDRVVPVENARRLHDALVARGGRVELHIFADAPHGFALRTPQLPAGKWPELCAAWLRQVTE